MLSVASVLDRVVQIPGGTIGTLEVDLAGTLELRRVGMRADAHPSRSRRTPDGSVFSFDASLR